MIAALIGMLAQPAAAATPPDDPVYEWVDPQLRTIPERFHGRWASSAAACRSDEVVVIEPRRLHFYEAHAFLRLGVVGSGEDGAEFYGYFDFNSIYSFWTGTTRISEVPGGISITPIEDPNADTPNTPRLVRCR